MASGRASSHVTVEWGTIIRGQRCSAQQLARDGRRFPLTVPTATHASQPDAGKDESRTGDEASRRYTRRGGFVGVGRCSAHQA
jgi:hypothetical protein